jgi:hypothetical protein
MSFSFGYKVPWLPSPAVWRRPVTSSEAYRPPAFRLEGADETNVEQQIREGIMIIGGRNPGAAEKAGPTSGLPTESAYQALALGYDPAVE